MNGGRILAIRIRAGRVEFGGSTTKSETGYSLPLPKEAIEELRIYLEDYHRFPIGLLREDAEKTCQQSLPAWGMAIRKFLSDAAGAAFDGLAEGDALVIEAEDPVVQAIPWEICTNVSGQPLMLGGTTVQRAIVELGPDRVIANEKQLRLLLVISRSGGISDVPHQLMARSLIALNVRIGTPLDITVLRPPTFHAFAEHLADADRKGVPFNIVHFDGHGVFEDEERGAMLQFEAEDPSDGPDSVGSADLANAIRAGRVELVVLNACRSAYVTENSSLDSTMGPKLLASSDIAAIVAMSYVVSTKAAQIFVEEFYSSFLVGRTVAESVNRGRQALAARPERPTIDGPIALADWMIPVLYSRARLNLACSSKDIDQSTASEIKAAPMIGRDDQIMLLERAFLKSNSVMLFGPIGIGKSTLAGAFAQWAASTGGLGEAKVGKDRVYRISFRDTDPLDVLKSTLSALKDKDAGGYSISTLLVMEELDLVPIHLQKMAHLQSFQESFNATVQAINLSGHALLIVSRTPEDWVEGVERFHLGPLETHEVTQLIDQTAPRNTDLADPKTHAFVNRCYGHPGTLVALVPLLKQTAPATLLAMLDAEPKDWTASFKLAVKSQGFDNTLYRFPDDVCRLTALLATQLETFDPALLATLIEKLPNTHWFDSDSAPSNVSLLVSYWLDFGICWHIDAHGAFVSKFSINEEQIEFAPIRLHPLFAARAAILAEDVFKEECQAMQQHVMTAIIDARAARCEELIREIEVSSNAERHFALLGAQFDAYNQTLDSAIESEAIMPAVQIYGALSRLSRNSGDRQYEVHRLKDILPKVPPPASNAPLDSMGYAWIANSGNEAKRLLDVGSLEAAEAKLQEIISIVEDIPEANHTRALVYRLMGQVNGKRSSRWDAEAALAWFARCEALSRSQNLTEHLAKCLYDTAVVLEGLLRIEEAVAKVQEAIELRRDLPEKREFARALTLLSRLTVTTNPPGARSSAIRAAAFANEAGSAEEKERAHLALADQALLEGKIQSAHNELLRVIKSRVAVGNNVSALLYHRLGNLHIRSEPQRAAKWYRLALKTAQIEGDDDMAQVVLMSLLSNDLPVDP